MTNDLRSDLTRMLDQYDERQRIDRAREQQGRDDDTAFMSAFAELRRQVVWPVFKMASELLVSRGHGVEIDEEEFAIDAEGKVREAGISLRIAPAGMPAPLHAGDHERSLSITTRHYNKTLWINAGRANEAGGVAGAKGAYPLGQVDRHLVEEAVLKLVGAVMAPG